MLDEIAYFLISYCQFCCCKGTDLRKSPRWTLTRGKKKPFSINLLLNVLFIMVYMTGLFHHTRPMKHQSILNLIG